MFERATDQYRLQLPRSYHYDNYFGFADDGEELFRDQLEYDDVDNDNYSDDDVKDDNFRKDDVEDYIYDYDDVVNDNYDHDEVDHDNKDYNDIDDNQYGEKFDYGNDGDCDDDPDKDSKGVVNDVTYHSNKISQVCQMHDARPSSKLYLGRTLRWCHVFVM